MTLESFIAPPPIIPNFLLPCKEEAPNGVSLYELLFYKFIANWIAAIVTDPHLPADLAFPLR